MNETSIAQAGTNYRKGVIFGLTMAEILLLLIFCLLLFMTTLNKKINEYEKQEIILQNQNQEYLTSIQMLEEKNSQYQKNIKTLKNQNSLYQNNLNALGKSTSVPQEVYDVVEKMNDEELFKFVENSEIASTVSSVDFKKIFEKAEKWDIATNKPQNLDVNKITDFAKTLSPKELSKLIENSELASTLSSQSFNEIIKKAEQWDIVTNQPQNPKIDIITDFAKELKPEELTKLIENAYAASQIESSVLDAALEEFNKPKEKPLDAALKPMNPKIRELAESVSLDDLKMLAEGKMEEKVEAGNNWPPIISLPEAENYSFKLGSAQLTESFKGQLSNEIVDQILLTLSEYDADLIEVIGHTDLQPMSIARDSNLDNSSSEYLEVESEVSLRARDNAGLGYARALSVTKHLLETPELKDYTILPYSAAQMITPNHTITTKDDRFDSSQLRRIEIRVRRQNR